MFITHIRAKKDDDQEFCRDECDQGQPTTADRRKRNRPEPEHAETTEREPPPQKKQKTTSAAVAGAKAVAVAAKSEAAAEDAVDASAVALRLAGSWSSTSRKQGPSIQPGSENGAMTLAAVSAEMGTKTTS